MKNESDWWLVKLFATLVVNLSWTELTVGLGRVGGYHPSSLEKKTLVLFQS